jgi:hypothetical protein
MAENRTRINCLEGSYADHYTTNASCRNRTILRNLYNVNSLLLNVKQTLKDFVMTFRANLFQQKKETLLLVRFKIIRMIHLNFFYKFFIKPFVTLSGAVRYLLLIIIIISLIHFFHITVIFENHGNL